MSQTENKNVFGLDTTKPAKTESKTINTNETITMSKQDLLDLIAASKHASPAYVERAIAEDNMTGMKAVTARIEEMKKTQAMFDEKVAKKKAYLSQVESLDARLVDLQNKNHVHPTAERSAEIKKIEDALAKLTDPARDIEAFPYLDVYADQRGKVYTVSIGMIRYRFVVGEDTYIYKSHKREVLAKMSKYQKPAVKSLHKDITEFNDFDKIEEA